MLNNQTSMLVKRVGVRIEGHCVFNPRVVDDLETELRTLAHAYPRDMRGIILYPLGDAARHIRVDIPLDGNRGSNTAYFILLNDIPG